MRTCVYTVLLGGYDALLSQPAAVGSDSDFLCFTDDTSMTSDTWEIVHVEPRFPQDLHRSSRVIKILGHERLSEYDVTLCIDASVRLLRSPEDIIGAWLGEDADMALVRHSYREQVVDEFDEVVRLNYDDRSRVYEQLVDYATAYPDVLEAKPHWGGMLVRRQNDAVADAMRLWFDHVLRYSRRDQLSLMVALLHSGIRYDSLEVDNLRSEWHEWPIIDQRRVVQGKAALLPSGPMISEMRRAQRHVDELEVRLGAVDEELSQTRVQLEQALMAVADRETNDAAVAEQVQRLTRERDESDERLRAVSGVIGAARHLRLALAGSIRRKF